MTVSLILSKPAFQKASNDLRDAAFLARVGGCIKPERLHSFLRRLNFHRSGSDDLLVAANRLAHYLNGKGGKPKWRHCLQALAQEFAGCSYQELRGCWFPDVYNLFTNIRFSETWAGLQQMPVCYLYPTELDKFPNLSMLRIAWEAGCAASFEDGRAFLPPMPPASVFGVKKFASAEIFRSWRPGYSGVISDGTMGVILKDDKGAERGAVRWHWWGAQFSRSDFHLIFRDGEGWIRIMMDVQPVLQTAPVPIHGPVIDRLSEQAFRSGLSDLREIPHLGEEAAE